MKKVQLALGALLLVALISAFSLIPKTTDPIPAPTAKENVKVVDWCKWFKFNNSYTIPDNSDTGPLGTATNYDDGIPVPSNLTTSVCIGGTKFCGVKVCAVLANTPVPTNTQIAAAVEAKRIAVGDTGFTQGLSWTVTITIGGVPYDFEFTIYRKP